MIRCKKCNISVDTIGDTCPLCGSSIEKNVSPTYPLISSRPIWLYIKRGLLLSIILISLIVGVINYIVTPETKWALFVFAGLFSMYFVFLSIINNRKRIFSLLFSICFIFILITIVWDKMLGFKGWSLNYVLPSLAISYGVFLLVMRFVAHFILEENTHFIYANVLLEFVPILLYYKGLITFLPLALISAFLGILNLAILLVFDFSHLKKDMTMRLHI